MVWIVICIVPFGMLVIESGMNLNWAYMAAQVFIAPFITPLFLTIGWAGAKAQALIAGLYKFIMIFAQLKYSFFNQ